MNKKNLKRVLFISTLIFAVIAGMIWYYAPVKCTSTIELSCDDPNENPIYTELNLKISRSLFSPDRVDGTILIGGKKYEAWTWEKYDFFSNILREVKGEIDIPCFINSANLGKGQDTLISDLLWINNIQLSDNYEIANVRLMITSDDRGIWSSNCVLP